MELFSLIYPQGTRDESPVRTVARDLITNLGADWFFHSRDCRLVDYLTADPAVIEYRRTALRDVMECPTLRQMLRDAAELLRQIEENIKRRDSSGDSFEAQFFSIRELEIYIELVDCMHKAYLAVDVAGIPLRSEGFIALRESVEEQMATVHQLREGLSRMVMAVKDIKSVTIGFNLDTNLSPFEAGLLSINDSPVRSGELIDRLLNLDLEKDSLTALAPMTAVSRRLTQRERESVDMVFMGAMRKVYGGALRPWAPMIRKYVAAGACSWLRLLPEMRYLTVAADLLTGLTEQGLPLCWAEVCSKEEKAFSVKGMYNPALAMKLKEVNPDAKMVCNDLTFDTEGGIYILTGPNSGGKSIFTCGVGILQIMFQLGMPIPASEGRLSPVDGIFTHFPSEVEVTTADGRLGSECALVKRIFDKLTPHSLVLLDETFSGTGSFEGSFLAADVLAALSAHGVHAVYCTHMHELTTHIPEVNARPEARSVVATLSAGSEGGERFRIFRRAPDGKSYAARIAAKYGLSYGELVKNSMK
ncbi:MAG: hypothetical protein IJX72_06550 [Clostridia bacterium]|nr:hypothetical protein [Clostridia bacterium]